MKRTKATSRSRNVIFPLLAASLLVISNIEMAARSTEKVIDRTSVATEFVVDSLKNENAVYINVETLPEYPGGTAALIQYMTNNLKYPVSAQEKNIQGCVAIQFTVDETGKVTNPKVVRSVDPEIDAEAVRVIESMYRWTPGNLYGENVPVHYDTSIMFEIIEGKAKIEVTEVSLLAFTIDGVTVPRIVEVQPEYPGGTSAMLHFLGNNIKYPTKAIDKKIGGKVIISFIIDETGTITHPKIIRSVDPEIDAEALRVIKLMPKWTPAKLEGKDVATYYTFPINFKAP